MAPEDKPEGDMTWIAGYWAWDDDRADYLVGQRLLARQAARQGLGARLLA